MNNFNIIKLICWVSICLAIWSFIPLMFSEDLKTLFGYQILAISDYFIHWITRALIGGYNYIYLAFNIVLALGAMFALTSKLKDIALLKFSWLLISNFNLFKIIELFLLTKKRATYYSPDTSSFSDIAPFLVFHLIVLLISIFFTRKLFQDSNTIIGNEELKVCSKTQRLVHYLIDFFFALLLSFTTLYLIENVFQISDRSIIAIAISLASLIYYIFSEILFRSTLGKLLTNSIILTNTIESMDNKNILMVLLRI